MESKWEISTVSVCSSCKKLFLNSAHNIGHSRKMKLVGLVLVVILDFIVTCKGKQGKPNNQIIVVCCLKKYKKCKFLCKSKTYFFQLNWLTSARIHPAVVQLVTPLPRRNGVKEIQSVQITTDASGRANLPILGRSRIILSPRIISLHFIQHTETIISIKIKEFGLPREVTQLLALF